MIRNLSILLVSAFALSACMGFKGSSPAPVVYRGDGPKGTMKPEARPVPTSPTPIMDDTPIPASKPSEPVSTEGLSEQEKVDMEMLDQDPQQPSADYKPVQKLDLPPPAQNDGKTHTLSEQEELDMLDEGPRGPAPVDLQPNLQTQPPAQVQAAAMEQPPLAVVVPTSERPGSIKVQKGDTLFSLSEKYQVALEPLIEVNHLRKPYHLKVGQRLKLPAPLHYRVRKGDTLYSIARKYGMDFQSLAMINGIDAPYAIAPNTILILPALVGDPKGGWKPAPRKTVVASTVKKNSKKPVAKPVIRKPASTSTFQWPIKGKVISSFGGKSGGMRNDGINIAARSGEAVHAAGNGTVIYAGSELKNYGMLILIRHSNGWVTAYAHNASAKVKEGAKVKTGDVIALAGSSGSVDSPQLHFETRKGVKPVNPLSHLPAHG